MSSKISRDILEAFLHCHMKGHLKSIGETGSQSEYEGMLVDLRTAVRLQAIDTILARQPAQRIESAALLNRATLKRGASFIFDAVLEDDYFSLRFDGLKRVDGPSKLGDFHFVPMLFHESSRIQKQQKLLLSLFGLLLEQIQGKQPVYGIVWHGTDCRATKVQLDTHRQDAKKLLETLHRTLGKDEPPLILIDHCKVCEFQQRCNRQATAENNLSLLRGIGAKEMKRYARKGIFTVAQLAHTFRPRRKGKRTAQRSHVRQHALQSDGDTR